MFALSFVRIFFAALLTVSFASAATVEELRKSIDERNKEFTEVNAKIQETQKAIDETEAKGKTLNSEIKKADKIIDQLNLSVKSSEISIQKLTLEIESLNYDIEDVKEGIDSKREAVRKILQEIQKKDEESLLELLLKNRSLAESFLEIQSLNNLNSGLALEVENLKSLNVELNGKLENASVKKDNLVIENQNLKSRQGLLKDQRSEKLVFLKETKNQEKQYQKLLAELEEKQAKIGAEIEEIESKLRSLFDPTVLPTAHPGVLSLPLPFAKISQEYGATAFAQRAYKTKFHNGIDLSAPLGTPVYAADDGQVIAVDNNDRGTSRWQKFQYGRYILVQHDNNLATLYAHLSRQTVAKGSTVKRGDLIGYSGNSGYSFGPHLHFTVYWAPSIQFKSILPAAGLVPLGVTVNPLNYL